MPHKSLRAIREDLRRRRSTDRLVDLLLVVHSHEGKEIFRCGGKWNPRLKCYTGDDATPHIVKLKESQCVTADGEPGPAYGFARWLEQMRADDPARPVVLMLAGDRGSGKTWLGALILVAIALEWPGKYQFCVNLSTPQRLEVIEAIEEVCPVRTPDDEWLPKATQSDDLRDPWSRFLNGSSVGWLTAKNPKRLRQAKLDIRNVFINEGQDQPERVYFNAQGATRNRDGITTIATNRPQTDAGEWVATVAESIDAGKTNGLWYLLDAKKNDAVDRNALDKRHAAILAVSREAAAADFGGGGMRSSILLAFPDFSPLPAWKQDPATGLLTWSGGHVGDPPVTPQLGRPAWTDITREATAELVPGGDGYEYVVGADFQHRPGIVGVVGKIFRAEDRRRVLVLLAFVGAYQGDEIAFSTALERKGYSRNPNDPTSVLIIGDGTGAKQNGRHRWDEPSSFKTLKNDEGWMVIPPTYTRRNRKPDNPLVKDSLGQMGNVFRRRQVLVAPGLEDPQDGFHSVVESLRRAKRTPRGGLVDKGNLQHQTDPVRYLAWPLLPREGPPLAPQGLDEKTFDAIASVRVLGSSE